MSEHTPGPWRWEGGALLGPEDNNASFGDCMCRLVIGGELENEMDKRLIVAAPALLEALEGFAKVRFYPFGDPYPEDMDAFAEKAEAAVRAALGDEAFEAKYPGSKREADEDAQ